MSSYGTQGFSGNLTDRKRKLDRFLAVPTSETYRCLIESGYSEDAVLEQMGLELERRASGMRFMANMSSEWDELPGGSGHAHVIYSKSAEEWERHLSVLNECGIKGYIDFREKQLTKP